MGTRAKLTKCQKKNPANWGHLQLENAHIYLSDIVNVQDLD